MTGGDEGTHTGWRLAGLALAWLAGVALQLNERVLMAQSRYALAALVALLCFAFAWRRRRVFVLALAGMALIGFGASGWRACERWDSQLPAALEGRDIQLTGVVANLPQRGASGLRFRFEVEQASLGGAPVPVPDTIVLGWYKGFHEDAALSQPQQELGAGQRWRFTAKLRQPHGNLNPHGFDYELTLFEQSVRATGYVRDNPAPQLIARGAAHPIERARQAVRDAIDLAVSDRRAAGVLAALSVGDQSAIEREDWDLFRNTGIAHLVSISGLHVTMFAWLAGLIVSALWRRSVTAMRWLPAQQAARWGGLLAALAYALFSGWGVPSQRTVWMLATVTLLQAQGRRWPWTLVLLAAAVVVSALDPWALLQPGFWLSFVAVGLLMASNVAHAAPQGSASAEPSTGWINAAGRHLRGELRSQVVATIGLTPLTLVFFQQVSLVGLLANLVAIPLVTLLITPLALLGTAAAPLWWLGAWLVRQMCNGLTWLASWPGAVWTVPVAPAWAQAAGIAAAILLVLPLPWRLRALALPLALPLLMPPSSRPEAGRFEVMAVDVGQGTSVFVRTHDHLLVYDAGPQYSRDSDAGQRVLLPLLRSRGEPRIDRLMLSHRDNDHVDGARALLQGMPVTDMWSSLEDGHPLLALAKEPSRCRTGQSWQWDGVRFDVLQPDAMAYDAGLKSNAMSCVLRVSSERSGSLLLTGDIEREQEGALVERSRDALRSDLLLVAHHGSRTSSSADFLDAVQPQVALIQAGYRNRFGHPVPEVLARLHERDVLVAATTACGAWRWRSDRPPATGVCERDRARRYWHHRVPPP